MEDSGRVWFHLDYAGGTPLYVQLRDQIKRAIATGVLRPGDRLPSVRDLALRLTINPNTVFKVYRELERQGVIQTVRGKGAFVGVTRRRLVEQERRELLYGSIDHLLAQACHLGYGPEDVKEAVNRRLTHFRWRTGCAAEEEGERDAGGGGQGQRAE